MLPPELALIPKSPLPVVSSVESPEPPLNSTRRAMMCRVSAVAAPRDRLSMDHEPLPARLASDDAACFELA